jgi:hypothetical protein
MLRWCQQRQLWPLAGDERLMEFLQLARELTYKCQPRSEFALKPAV